MYSRPLWSRYRPVVLTVVCVLLSMLSTLPGAPARAAAAVPTASQQLDWLLGATARSPVPEAEIEQHLTSAGLAAIGGPDRLNDVLASVADSRIVYRTRTTQTVAEAVTRAGDGQEYLTTVQVDADGLIAVVFFADREAAPTSWTQVDRQLRALAPEVSFAAARIGPHGSTRIVHGLNPGRSQPLGSAFKLYVLGALARAVGDHTASWSQQLAIRNDWKSLGSGELYQRPAGTKLTLARFADYMISISDNTAADHLVHRLGRSAVESQLTRFGNSSPLRTTPFLTTRELFALKGSRFPVLAKAYRVAPRALKPVLLRVLDGVPLSSLTAWQQPRDVNSIEWFASSADICRAFAGLQQQAVRPGMAPLGHALSINDGGIGLDPHRYPIVWFKGGSEPGVLTLNYLARDAGGTTTVVSVLLADPRHALDEDVLAQRAQAIIRGAFALGA